MKKIVIAAAGVVAVLALAGCGEKPQVAEYKQGKYQGKPDTKPWDNNSSTEPYVHSTWTPGDRSSWETALRNRAQNQNEYVRTNPGG
jgi:predicted small lipoprotein YifL